MKKLILVLCLAGLAGCSTTENGGEEAPRPTKKSGSAKAEELPTTATQAPLPPPVPIAKQTYTALSKAFDDKNYKEVFALSGQMLSQNPNDVQALNALAMYHMQKSEWGAARLLLERALEKNKDVSGLYNNLGVIALREDNLETAIIHFKTAYEKDRKNPTAANNLGSIYVKYLDYGKAEPLIDTAYSYMPDATSVANNYAIVKRSKGNFDAAADLYKKILAKEPRNVSTLLNYAILLIDYMKKYDEGEKLLNKLEFLESNEPYVKVKVTELHTKIQAARK
jgi:Flp pilus assembly protein TadD